MATYCTRCGATLEPDVAYCTQCGHAAPAPQTIPGPSQTPEPARVPPPRRRSPWMIVGVVAGSITAVGALVALTTQGKSVTSESLPSALTDSDTSVTPTSSTAATPATTTSPAQESPALAVTPQQAMKLTSSEARSQLKDHRRTDRYDLDAVRYSWAPQVSSKCEGLDNADLKPAWFPDGRSDTSHLTAQQILAFHLSLASRDGALLVIDKDVGDRMVFSGCSGRTMWMAVIPKSFGSATGANRWCDRNGYPAGECAARYVVDAGDSGAKVKWRT